MLVNLQWTGQCDDPAVRRSLVRHLRELATQLDDLAGLAPRHRVFDCLLQGRILIDGSLFGDTYPCRGLTQVGENVYLVKQLRLYGVQLWVIDPRKPELAMTSRASFVFALDHGSVLDGLLVKVLGHAGHDSGETAPDKESAHCILTTAGVTLRPAQAFWLTNLLGWVKHFYLPSLRYVQQIENPNYEKFADVGAENYPYRDLFLERLFEEARQVAESLRDVS